MQQIEFLEIIEFNNYGNLFQATYMESTTEKSYQEFDQVVSVIYHSLN